MQPDIKDCGPACIKIICSYYGRSISMEKIRILSETTRQGSSLLNLSDAAEKIGFRTIGIKTSFEKLKKDIPLPCIIHWQQSHFVVVYKIRNRKVFVADPAHGLLDYSIDDFLRNWIGINVDEKTEDGIGLTIAPSPHFYEFDDSEPDSKEFGFKFLFKYLKLYKKLLFQLLIGLIAGTMLQFAFPFLTQSIVDIGIQNQDFNFVFVILIAQLCLFLGTISIELIRGWILLHLSTRINISLISDFFIKLMKLPIAFFDNKMTGDIMQRIGDHKRIESLLTTSSLNAVFSFFNLAVFGTVLAWYNAQIFLVFLLGSLLYVVWLMLFLKKRKRLDYKMFSQLSSEQSMVIELINGMQEIKLHNAEKQKRWSWEYLQAQLFKIEIKNLTLQQMQTTGANFINEVKNILITFLSAKLVIDGEITLGMMMAITYIIGQLNNPIQQLISFIYAFQDASIALERLAEIHNKEDEEKDFQNKRNVEKEAEDIVLSKVQYRYAGAQENVIDELSLTIPLNKTTAIVGASGSGKTTLMKILLKFYIPDSGHIYSGSTDINMISHSSWRKKCGVVMQEGYIFNDTIANNIAIGQNKIDQDKLFRAVKVANIKEFVNNLPMGFNTKIGMDGMGISSGQKQRLLIARAVYKNPDIICFDEATSALDAKNERIIMENLNEFFKDRTAVVIAHRLSTVKNADQIVVLDKGKIIEKGTHQELVKLKGSYFTLVKNQLDLEKLNN